MLNYVSPIQSLPTRRDDNLLDGTIVQEPAEVSLNETIISSGQLDTSFPDEGTAPFKVFGMYEPICEIPTIPDEHFTQNELNDWSEWGMWIKNLPDYLKSGTIRKTLDRLPDFPFLPILNAKIEKYINLAFVILSFAVNCYVREPCYQLAVNHAYLDAGGDAKAGLPYNPNLIGQLKLPFLPDKYAVPIIAITKKMGTAPLLSYSTVALLNYKCNKNGPDRTMDDYELAYTITGTSHEKYFYIIPLYVDHLGTSIRAQMEIIFEILKGKSCLDHPTEQQAIIIEIMESRSKSELSYEEQDGIMGIIKEGNNSELSPEEQTTIIGCLEKIRAQSTEIKKVLNKMYSMCSKEEFMLFRFFFNGFHQDSIYENGLRHGKDGPIITAHGASAAQCPTIHLLSHFLGMAYCDFLKDQFSMIAPDVKGLIKEAGFDGRLLKALYVNKKHPQIRNAWNELVKTVTEVRKIHRSFVSKFLQDKQGTGGTFIETLETILQDTKNCKSPDEEGDDEVSEIETIAPHPVNGSGDERMCPYLRNKLKNSRKSSEESKESNEPEEAKTSVARNYPKSHSLRKITIQDIIDTSSRSSDNPHGNSFVPLMTSIQ